MPTILNKASIRTGIDLIDRQHFKYIHIANDMVDNIGDSKQNKELFKELNSYVIYHFETEEEFMNRYSYDNTVQHVKQHDYFRDKIIEFTRLYSGNASFDVKIKIKRLLIDWFIEHIKTEDKRLCEFILAQSAHNPGIIKKLKTLLIKFIAKHGEDDEWV